eukprot:GHVT01053968.1.p1 GENE.GHVT01053968.1~~GHVT01053968.1.p1  ORF type:complete len:104 (-),score=10.62 GHVT01053968.1:1687-1998(-)
MKGVPIGGGRLPLAGAPTAGCCATANRYGHPRGNYSRGSMPGRYALLVSVSPAVTDRCKRSPKGPEAISRPLAGLVQYIGGTAGTAPEGTGARVFRVLTLESR